ncbi:MAG: cell division protein FtsA [Pseudomonadota bacterium]|nr:cell division protein FtsA [Pseudomonadota bacterium]
MSRETKDLIVGLDIGTSKIVALVAEVSAEGRLNVIGIGSQESKGLKKGVVVNIEETVAAISRVVQEVELMADCKVKDVYTGIAGSHIRSFNSNGMVAIKDKEVLSMDVERVIETARAMPIPADQEILHILTQEFIIDDQDSIREPIGMSGFRLEVKVHIVTGAVSAAQNIVKCVRRCGIEVLSTKPWREAHALLEALRADVTQWQAAADQFNADSAWNSLDPKFPKQLEASRHQLTLVWEAFCAALEQAAAAAENAEAPLPAVPVWADELRLARGEAPAAVAAGAAAIEIDPAQLVLLQAKAAEVVGAALAALQQNLAEGHNKATPKAVSALRAALKEHGRHVAA